MGGIARDVAPITLSVDGRRGGWEGRLPYAGLSPTSGVPMRPRPVNAPTTTRRLAVVGSSGGNLYSHGGDDPVGLVGHIRRQAAAAGMEVTAVQLVAVDSSMDAAGTTPPPACTPSSTGTSPWSSPGPSQT